MDNLISEPYIPYVGPIGCGGKFIPQNLIRIKGTVPGISNRFNINLQCGPYILPQDDVALQISVRLLDGCICLNSLERGIWDEEQRKNAVPIKRTERFEVVILCEFSKYGVAINGQYYCEFPQRIHCDRISHLSIDGDVFISKISYESVGEESTTRPSFPMPAASIVNENDDFEMFDNVTAPLTGYPLSSSQLQLNSSSGFYPPPTTGYTLPNNSYPPNNNNIDVTPPPTYEETLSGPPYPTGLTTMHPQPMQPTFPTALHPPPMQPTFITGLQPPPGTIIPHNAINSNFVPVQPSSCDGRRTLIIIIVITIFILAIVLFVSENISRNLD